MRGASVAAPNQRESENAARDATASHYLKLVLDAIFGVRNFVNEVIWKRSDAHNDYDQGPDSSGASTT